MTGLSVTIGTPDQSANGNSRVTLLLPKEAARVNGSLHCGRPDFEAYLVELSGAAPLGAWLSARRIWGALKRTLPQLQQPASGLNEDGVVNMVWRKNQAVLEVEIQPDGRAEYFFWDRSTDETESGTIPGAILPYEVTARLNNSGKPTGGSFSFESISG